MPPSRPEASVSPTPTPRHRLFFPLSNGRSGALPRVSDGAHTLARPLDPGSVSRTRYVGTNRRICTWQTNQLGTRNPVLCTYGGKMKRAGAAFVCYQMIQPTRRSWKENHWAPVVPKRLHQGQRSLDHGDILCGHIAKGCNVTRPRAGHSVPRVSSFIGCINPPLNR